MPDLSSLIRYDVPSFVRLSGGPRSISLVLHPCADKLFREIAPASRDSWHAQIQSSGLSHFGLDLPKFSFNGMSWGFGGAGQLFTNQSGESITAQGIVFDLPQAEDWSPASMRPFYNILASLHVATQLLEKYQGEGGWNSHQGLVVSNVNFIPGHDPVFRLIVPPALGRALSHCRICQMGWKAAVGKAMYQSFSHMVGKWWRYMDPFWLTWFGARPQLIGPDSARLVAAYSNHGEGWEMRTYTQNRNPLLNAPLALMLLVGAAELSRLALDHR
ncbi:MAG: hypothetical protein WCT32_04770 [Patescibacteria group bacterium]|jgi:hypothetical protein